jgi:hypothetical protein
MTLTSPVLKELFALKEEYRKQFFVFTDTQKARYAELLNKRRDIVKQWYKDGKVSNSSKVTTKPVNKEVK